jgi:hypothetical protein
MKKKTTEFPAGWNERRVKGVLRHYENQTDEQATAEDNAAFANRTDTTMKIPIELVETVRKLIAKRRPS